MKGVFLCSKLGGWKMGGFNKGFAIGILFMSALHIIWDIFQTIQG